METTKQNVRAAARSLGILAAQVGDDYDVAEGIAAGYAEGTPDKAAVLAELVELSSLELAVRQVIEWRVEDARKAGYSWERIGEALGMSRQAAWEKYRPTA